MKKLTVLLFGIIFSNMIFAQTFDVSFNDIYSTDSISAWIVGDEGTILHINGGGTSFDDHSYPTSLNLNSICFTNEQRGFIVGDSGLVLRTYNAGETWNIVDLGVTNYLSSIEFYNDQYGWINTFNYDGGVFFRTIDGGNTWITITSWVNSTYFLDSLNGWGYMPVSIVRTFDGGSSWTNISDYPGTGGMQICFMDTSNGFYYGHAMGNSFSRKTIDGGLNWSPTPLGDENYGLRDINFLDTLNGWVCGTGNIFYSNDLFETFSTFQFPGILFMSLSIHGYSNGWAVGIDYPTGFNGSVWKLDGINNWVQLDLVGMSENNNSESIIKCFPNPFAEIVTIDLEINNMENIKISIHDQLGKEIETLFEGKKNKKTFQLTWDSGNLPTGVYLVKFQTENEFTTQKIIKN
jgi:photosystem II stability/assembly factor-like uncharacterized protein